MGAQISSSPEDYVNHSLYLEAKTFLHGLLLVEDKLSMAHGLETRVPFLDNDLVDFAQTVPVNLKLGNLRRSSGDENEPGPRLSASSSARATASCCSAARWRATSPRTSRRRRSRASAPDASWYRGESIDYLRRTFVNGDAAVYDFLDRETVHALVRDHLEGRENRRLLIWSLLSFEEWLRTFQPAA